MIHSEAALRRIGLHYHDIVRGKDIRIGLNTLPMYVIEGAGGGESVDRLRALVDRLPKPMQLSLRRVVGFVRKARAARRG